jgi:hypothetical protein
MRSQAIHMENGTPFQDIQKEFSDLYPFLRMDFFRPVAIEQKGAVRLLRISPHERIKLLSKGLKGVSVSMEETRTVQEIIDYIENAIGVTAIIFRKAGNTWIETLLTSGWSLAQQNREGMLIS